ncbi:MAG: bifunctional folylpolyglutamate synthase/dihydrofolate synthase [Chlamydiia bacterium]|nr:bifunctional folylpolyglutamate synthase/dihydrofolate synthase [Chlamydiia bacterium]
MELLMLTKLNSESYKARIEKLFLRRNTKSLETMQRLKAIYPLPKTAIHIAGTNGKGSVSIKIAKGLEASGYKVGLYTSPHIACFRERIQINGKKIPEEAVLKLLPDHEEGSFFEITTWLAFRWFCEEQVDYAVIETGLGGRWDATNIIRPILSIITSIGMDHTEILGDTLEKIATEKGGIIKPGVPVISGPKADYYPEALRVTGDFKTYEEENCAIAKRALEWLGVSTIEEGLKARQPCRMEWVLGRVLFDVAHNPPAFEKLAKELKGQKFSVVAFFSPDKDQSSCLRHIEPITERLIKKASPLEALKEALEYQEPVLVTGTFRIMAELKDFLLKEFLSTNKTKKG